MILLFFLLRSPKKQTTANSIHSTWYQEKVDGPGYSKDYRTNNILAIEQKISKKEPCLFHLAVLIQWYIPNNLENCIDKCLGEPEKIQKD